MTDGHLMDAECIHGNVWFECEVCDEDRRQEWNELAAEMGHSFYRTPMTGNTICRDCGLMPFDDDAVTIPCPGERR